MDLSNFQRRPRRSASVRGYSLVEVLVASSILAIGLAAACAMSLMMVTQEEMNHRMARNYNLQENAARLYQIGLNASDVVSLLPGSSDMTLTFTPSVTTIKDPVTDADLIDIPAQTITATINSTPEDSVLTSDARGWTGGGRRADSSLVRATRVTDLVVYRAAP